MTDSRKLLRAGEIGKAHGIRGEVYMVPISDDPHRWDPGARLVHEDGRTLTVESSHRHRGSRLLVKFAGVEGRAEAEGLRGPVYVESAERRVLEEGEFWQADLVGCAVVDADGLALGEVTSVTEGAAQDLLEVATPRGSRLVPLVEAIVVTVDVEARRITVEPPEGLFE
ncbi:MAG: ribosome maturation factor RimM [Actinomycetota bacterium]